MISAWTWRDTLRAFLLHGEVYELWTPRIGRLDLRPRWERHPYLDMARRGERAWESGLELAAAAGHGYSRFHYRTRDERTYRRPRKARLRLPRIGRLDLRPDLHPDRHHVVPRALAYMLGLPPYEFRR